MTDYDVRYRELRAAGFDGWAGELCECGISRAAAVLDYLERETLIPKPPAQVLEIGCGNGIGTALLAARGYQTGGIDIAPSAIEWAEQRFADQGLIAKFQTGDVREMPQYCAGAFDMVVDGNCLHCLIGWDRERCLAEIWRVLRPNGMFIVSSMCGPPKSADAIARYDASRYVLLEQGHPSRTLKPVEALEQELSDAGFAVISTMVAEHPWWDHATIACRRPVAR